jgi:hypothetical protein
MTPTAFPDLLLLAADALTGLAEARYLAMRLPSSAAKTLAERAAKHAEARAAVPVCRTRAVGLLRLAATLLPFEPALRPGWEPPEWPQRRQSGESFDGPDELAAIVEVAAESGDDDDRFAEELRGWIRDYATLREETGAGTPKPGGPSDADLETALTGFGITPEAWRERRRTPMRWARAS